MSDFYLLVVSLLFSLRKLLWEKTFEWMHICGFYKGEQQENSNTPIETEYLYMALITNLLTSNIVFLLYITLSTEASF